MFYLNAMKIVFGSFHSVEEIMQMEDRELKMSLCEKIKESFQFIFPYIPKNLFKSNYFLTKPAPTPNTL